MQNFVFEKLNFLTAGMPLKVGKGSYEEAFEILDEMKLDGMELEFVHGVKMNKSVKEQVNRLKTEKNFVLTAHAPFYINLNAQEKEKVDASVQRIIETGETSYAAGAFSITFHAAYYLKQDKEKVYKKIKSQVSKISKAFEKDNINVWIRPETTGKPVQWGDLDEIIRLSNDFERVLPCVDFSHLHARTNGTFNTYDEFCKILDKIGKNIGTYALENFHGHLAGIDYGEKGEKKHLILEESDMNYKDLMKALKEFGVKGALVCESPNIENDAVLLKEYYLSL